MRLKYLSALALLTAAAATAIAFTVHGRSQPFKFRYENVLGTSMEVTVVAASEETAQAATGAVLARIDRDAKILSGYDPSSEFSRWFKTANTAVPVSPELYEVLSLFDT